MMKLPIFLTFFGLISLSFAVEEDKKEELETAEGRIYGGHGGYGGYGSYGGHRGHGGYGGHGGHGGYGGHGSHPLVYRLPHPLGVVFGHGGYGYGGYFA